MNLAQLAEVVIDHLPARFQCLFDRHTEWTLGPARDPDHYRLRCLVCGREAEFAMPNAEE